MNLSRIKSFVFMTPVAHAPYFPLMYAMLLYDIALLPTLFLTSIRKRPSVHPLSSWVFFLPAPLA